MVCVVKARCPSGQLEEFPGERQGEEEKEEFQWTQTSQTQTGETSVATIVIVLFYVSVYM